MIEYKIRPVTRYVITRFEQSDDGMSGGSETRGEYDNADTAFDVAYALCRLEHDKSGAEPGSMSFIYPTHPNEGAAPAVYVGDANGVQRVA